MSTVVVQIGQCGNQIGNHFWKLVETNQDCRNGGIFLHPGIDAFTFRSVNIDSEPKVVKRLLQDKRNNEVSFKEENCILGKRGRGSNWALGYSGHKDEGVLERGLEATRKEIERCDSFTGCVLLHSLGGGTGSGLGSVFTESLRDLYPLANLISGVVMPYISGESSLQFYNTLLCLNTLLNNSDAIALFSNDEVMLRLKQRRRKDSESSVSFAQINAHIADCLGGVLLPVQSLTSTSGITIGSEPGEMCRSVCPMPSHKFVHFNHYARSKMSWPNLAERMLLNTQRNGKFESISALAVARGDSTFSLRESLSSIEQRVRKAYRTVDWNPFPVDFWFDQKPLTRSASLSVAANGSVVVPHLQQTILKARQKFEARAYLHWYEKYDCGPENFEEAFATLTTAVDQYTSI